MAAALLSGCSLTQLLPGSGGEIKKAQLGDLPTAEEMTIKYNGYGFAALTSLEEKRLYAGIDRALQQNTSVEFTTEKLEDVDRVSDVLEFYKDDHPEVFWIDETAPYYYKESGGVLSVQLHYKLEGAELEQAKATLESKLEEITSEAPQGVSEYELELYVHNYIIQNCDYDTEAVEMHKQDTVRSNEQNVYGVLVEGRAVCEGYARAFQLLCERLDVRCWVIQGQALGFEGDGNTNHIWNCVMLNGEWYQVDVTWDDYDGAETFGDEQYYYFNLTTAEMEKDHVIAPSYSDYDSNDVWYNGFVPQCDSTEYYYFYRNAHMIYDLDDSGNIDWLVQAASTNDSYCVYMISEDLDFETTYNSIVQDYAYQWISSANVINGYEPNIGDTCKLSANDTRRIVTLILVYE